MNTDWDLFEIDPARLDEEWRRQPRLYHTNAVKLADARADYERFEAELKVVEAELDRAIRVSPVSYGLVGRVTEKQIANTIVLQKKHRNATSDVIEAKHLVGILDALVRSLDTRKVALENWVRLEARDYFSAPRIPRGVDGNRARDREIDRTYGSNKKDSNK